MTSPRVVIGVAAVVAAVAAALVVPPAGAAASSERVRASRAIDFPDRGLIDQEEDCLEPVPAAAEPAVVPGPTISLDVLVLADGISLDSAQAIMAKAAEGYKPLGISLSATYESVAFAHDGYRSEGEGKTPTGDADRLISDAKAWTGGAPPAGQDVVYVLTAKELFTYYDDDRDGHPDEDERSYGVAGMADCIGGVRYPGSAYAVGEGNNDTFAFGPLNFYVYGAAKIAAHEIGHLMGAHHHYANCAEGIPSELDQREVSPCTVMFNFLDFISINFGVLDGAVVRGHAAAYATP